MNAKDIHITNRWVTSRRSHKNIVDPYQPYAFLAEEERTIQGNVQTVATIFLTNRECPYRCLMCDLWKNTTDHTVPSGAIQQQIEFALSKLPQVRHVKLYNSGNFFDNKAIPPGDFPAIASLLGQFDTVLVENHPNLTNRKILDFRDLLKTNLQVAMGLETVHPHVLEKLNKSMTLEDFQKAATFLSDNDIPVRAFILLRAPFLTEGEGVYWAERSIDFAFNAGVECCVIIPTRTGNGALEELEILGYFRQPLLSSLEEVHDYGIGLARGRVFADLWDLERFSTCQNCLITRQERMHRMNLQQEILPKVDCAYCEEILR